MQQQQKGNSEVSRVILASGSPRRKALLGQMGIEPEVQVMGIDETPLPGEEAQRYVCRLATEKARAAAELIGASAAHERYIIAADTAVVCAGAVLGKQLQQQTAVYLLIDNVHPLDLRLDRQNRLP